MIDQEENGVDHPENETTEVLVVVAFPELQTSTSEKAWEQDIIDVVSAAVYADKTLDTIPYGEVVGREAKKEPSNLPPQISNTLKAHRCWAITEVQSHSAHLAVVARRKVDRAVNALRAFTHILFTRRNRCLFGMAGLVRQGMFSAFGRNEGATLSTVLEGVGYLVPFELTKDAYEFLQNSMEFGKLSDIVGEDEGNLTGFQQVVAVASGWIGQAAIADTLEDEFVKATIGLERLLICGDEETTTERIAMRLAHLIGEQPEHKRLLYTRVKRLYGVRSNIVHQGFVGVSEDEMDEMNGFVIEAFVGCLRLTETVKEHVELRELLIKRTLS